MGTGGTPAEATGSVRPMTATAMPAARQSRKEITETLWQLPGPGRYETVSVCEAWKSSRWGKPLTGLMRGRRNLAALATAIVLALAGAPASAAAPPRPQPYGANDSGGFLNIVPPGQNGHADATQVIAFSALGSVFGSGSAPVPPHARDQLDRYADLVYESPTLDPARLTDFYKDASFGVRSEDVEQRYSPRGDVTIVR